MMYRAALGAETCLTQQQHDEAYAACESQYVRGYATSGLGDAASDYRAAFAQYLADHRAWEAQVKAREAALVQHDAWKRRNADWLVWQTAYDAWQNRMDEYEACESIWDAYQAAVVQADQQRAAVERYYDTIGANIARHWGVDPSISCTNAMQKAQWAALCQSTRRDPGHVAGLGGEMQIDGIYYGTDASGVPYCALAELPLCQAMPATPLAPAVCPPNPGAPPKEPYAVGLEPIVPMVGPEPQPPIPPAGIMPECIPYDLKQEAQAMCQGTSGLLGLGALPEPYASDPCAAAALPVCPGTEPANEGKRSNLMIGSILLLVVAAGGYGIYRSMKK